MNSVVSSSLLPPQIQAAALGIVKNFVDETTNKLSQRILIALPSGCPVLADRKIARMESTFPCSCSDSTCNLNQYWIVSISGINDLLAKIQQIFDCKDYSQPKAAYMDLIRNPVIAGLIDSRIQHEPGRLLSSDNRQGYKITPKTGVISIIEEIGTIVTAPYSTYVTPKIDQLVELVRFVIISMENEIYPDIESLPNGTFGYKNVLCGPILQSLSAYVQECSRKIFLKQASAAVTDSVDMATGC